MSARVQSSYMSTKPSKFGAVNDSTNFSVSNNANQIFPQNLKSWMHGFDTQRAFFQSQISAFNQGDLQSSDGKTQGLNTPLDRDINTAAAAVGKNAIVTNNLFHLKQNAQIGTAIAGSRKNKLQRGDQGQNNIQNQNDGSGSTGAGMGDFSFSTKNPKTAKAGARTNLNRSIGHIKSIQEDQQQSDLKNKIIKLNMSTNFSGLSQNSKGFPSVFQNAFADENSSFILGDQHNDRVNFARFQVSQQKNLSMRGSAERDKQQQLIFTKNRQLMNVSEQVSKLKQSSIKRRAISLLHGGPNERPLDLDSHKMSQNDNHHKSIMSQIENNSDQEYIQSARDEKRDRNELNQQQKPNYLSQTQSKPLTKADKLIAMQKLIDNFPKIAIDHRIIEQWLNDTLSDAEHYKLPGVIMRSDYQNPVSRYGIDRMTLTNAGIPNDEVNHLYRAMFVYSVGFFNLIKDIVAQSKEVYLQSNEGGPKRHVTKFSIVTAVWRVFQILLEYTYRSDYQLLINRIQEDYKAEKEQREKEFAEILQDYKKTEFEQSLKIKNLQSELEQVSAEKLKELQHRKRLEEELLKNTKSHEDEVSLRLKFEEKLNNLHALNRITNQNLKTAKFELDHINRLYQEGSNYNKQLNQELAQEKVKASSYEQKYIYSEDKNNLLATELSEKQKHNERLLQELSDYIDKYELTNYKFSSCEKDLQNEKLKYEKLDIEFRHMKQMQEHYKRTFEESSQKNKVLNERLIELTLTYQKCHDELSMYKQEHVGFETSENQKQEVIESMKSELKFLQTKHRENDKILSEERAKSQLLEHELNTVKIDYDLATSKVEKINKARNEADMKVREKAQLIRQLEHKIHDRDEQIVRNHRKVHEQDEKMLEMEKQNTMLEKDKVSQRIEFDSVKRQQLDRIHSLEELIKNEKELRINWQERYEKESKQLSTQNLDVMEMRARVSEIESKMRHMLVESQNEKHINESLVKSKKELMDTVNRYIVKCEMMEKDLFAMKEVGKYFEQLKDQEHHELNQTLKRYKTMIINLEMQVEDFWTRLGNYSDHIMNQKSQILMLKMENDNKRIDIEKLNETVKEKESDIQEQKDKIAQMEDEMMMTKSSYMIIKQRMSSKDEEISQLEKQIKELHDKISKTKAKKKEVKQVRDNYEQELKNLKHLKDSMAHKQIQAGSSEYPTVNQEIQCILLNHNQKDNSQSILVNYVPQRPKNELEKYEYQKAEKDRKKKDQRELILKTTKLQNELHHKYDLSGINSATKIRKQQHSNEHSSAITNSANRLRDVNQLQATEQSHSNLSGSNTPSKHHNQHHPNSSLNIIKQVSEIQHRLSGVQQLPSQYQVHQHTSALNVVQVSSLDEQNENLISTFAVGAGGAENGLQQRERNHQNIQQQSQMQIRAGGQSLLGSKFNININDSQYPSTIMQAAEGHVEGFQGESIAADDEDADDLNHHSPFTQSQLQQNSVLRDIEESQKVYKNQLNPNEGINKQEKSKHNSKNQAQIHPQNDNKSINRPSQFKTEKNGKKQIKSLLRTAFS